MCASGPASCPSVWPSRTSRGCLSNVPWLPVCCTSALRRLSTATSPIWVIKTRLQLQRNRIALAAATEGGGAVAAAGEAGSRAPVYRGFFHATRSIWQTEGMRGMFKGVSASYLGICESVLQFTLYEKMKRVAGSSGYWGDGDMPPAASLLMGGTAKMVASIITYPHEVLRTRLREVHTNRCGCLDFPRPPPAQSTLACPCSPAVLDVSCRYTGIVQAARLIVKEEGAAAMYAGMGVHLLRTVPNAAIMFMIVEVITDGNL